MVKRGSSIHFGVVENTPDVCTGLECQLWAIATDPLVLVTMAFLALLFVQTFVVLRAAEGRCREERRRTRAEAGAFAEFADRVASMTPTAAAELGGPPTATIVNRSTGDDLAAVRDAYRETVMAVDHYDEEYGEDLHDNLAQEFGHDVAASLDSGGTLSDMLRRTLAAKSRESVHEREGFAEAIDDELDELRSIRRTFGAVEGERERQRVDGDLSTATRDFDELLTAWDRLEELEGRVEAVLEERQASLAEPPFRIDDVGPTFYEYLYAPLREASYPVLAEGVSLVDRIRSDRTAVMHGIARSY